ncbi:hypothetical protein H4R20_000050 [Coemansia guatemalensis]|uniref:P-type ATPase A domain-containing protein n=1 Tax=Coemansia guatemalensis TaxID=2761395 RepID=A0A9W8LVU8_9FUNG|nr:hypothetical protein H4R20_000050 [Coemansia guatemalensis]
MVRYWRWELTRWLQLVLVVVVCFALGGRAFPAFNTPNSVDTEGNTCPLADRSGLSCPVLCVLDIDDCPDAIAPRECAANEQLCDDGECHRSCDGVTNPCLCGQSTTKYNACAAYGKTVSVKNYDPGIKEQQIELACAKQWGLVADNATLDDGGSSSDLEVGAWGANATAAAIWGSCPEAQDARLTFTEDFCVAFYAIVGAEVLIYLLWHMYKSWRESAVVGSRQLCSPEPLQQQQQQQQVVALTAKGAEIAGDRKDEVHSGASSSAETLAATDAVGNDRRLTTALLPGGMLLMRGFDSSVVGAGLYWLTLTTTCGWMALLFVVVLDFYGKVRGGVAYGLLASSSTSMAVFIFVWHMAALWMIVVLLCQPRLRNYFRIESPLAQARVVQVEARRDAAVETEGVENRLTAWVGRMSARLERRLLLDIAVETCAVERVVAEGCGQWTVLEYHSTRYVLSELTGCFGSHVINLGTTSAQLLSSSGGLSRQQVLERQALIGENLVQVAVPSFGMGMVYELRGFLYLYQLMCMWVWFYFNYYKMACVQLGVILASAVVKVVIRQQSERRIKRLAERRRSCRVLRDSEWTQADTSALVPGDVVAAEDDMELMFDGCVLGGEAVVDESALTGEATPVRKLPLPGGDSTFDIRTGAGRVHTVLAGTRIQQSTDGAGSGQATHILVLRTRTQTDKGRLVQRMAFPGRTGAVFAGQQRVAMAFLLAYGGVGFALSVWLMGHDTTSWCYGVFVVSEVCSPLLPAALVAGQSVAAARLRRQRLFSVDLPRILLAAKVRVFCFDKTGTLTREGLDFFAAQPVLCDQAPAFGSATDVAPPGPVRLGLATCHAVTEADGRLIGNPVDIEQFRAAGWRLADDADTLLSPQGDETAYVERRFAFEHARQSMAVAVRDGDGRVHVFVKGSFERIGRMATADSVPGDYAAVAAAWARQGCYVLALAHRVLDAAEAARVAHMTREQLEAGSALAALVLFRNSLRDDTSTSIAELRRGGTRTVMVTGDAALTGVYVARQCGMVPPHSRVILGAVEQQQPADKPQLVWRDAATDEPVADLDALLAAEDTAASCIAGSPPPVELAVTEPAFQQLRASGALDGNLLLRIRVFGRMTPQSKADCIRLHMARAVTAMVGDASNDMAAIRAAHVGLALSAADASIVAPFSSAHRSVGACVTLLREGRAALATSLAAYKFLINYATTMSMLELVQFYFSVIVPQAVWISIDSFIAVGLCIAVTQAQTARTLASSRPTARLIGAHTLASVWGQTLVNISFLYGIMGLLFRQSWFRCHEFDSRDIDTVRWWLLGDNYEAEIISLVCLFQFVNGAAVYNFGYRFRRSWYTNYLLVVLYCGFMAAISVLVLADPNRFGCLFRINCGNTDVLRDLGYSAGSIHIDDYNSPIGHNVLPHRFRWTLWALCVTNVIVCLAYEKLVVLGPIGRWVRRWWLLHHGRTKLQLIL